MKTLNIRRQAAGGRGLERIQESENANELAGELALLALPCVSNVF